MKYTCVLLPTGYSELLLKSSLSTLKKVQYLPKNIHVSKRIIVGFQLE